LTTNPPQHLYIGLIPDFWNNPTAPDASPLKNIKGIPKLVPQSKIMPKKVRRRKGGDDETTAEVDVLPEDHTVADSIAASLDFEDDASIDDLLSTGGGSVSDTVQARYAKAVEVLTDIDDLLSEKRSTKREAGLRRIFRAVTQYGDLETLVPFQNDLIQLCMSSLRGGSPAEQYAACRCLEAQAVILGADQDEYYEAIEPNLKRIVMDDGPGEYGPRCCASGVVSDELCVLD
jgi:hypothetical protein